MRPLPDYTLSQKPFTTPRGNLVTLFVRDNTSDWNTCNSALSEDEYGLKDLYLTGKALDVGAHIGSVAIGLAVDNPGLEVTALEPVPPNVELLRRNLELNGLQDRVKVFAGSAGPKGVTSSEIRFGYHGNESADHHAFIGNTSLAYDDGGELPHEAIQVETLGLAALLNRYGITDAAFLKCDAEGAEWSFFDASKTVLRRLAWIVGEAHPVRGHVARDIVPMLEPTHEVRLFGEHPDPGPCGFLAVRR